MDGTLPPQLQKHHAVAVSGTNDDLAVKRSLAFAVFPQLGVSPGIECRESIFSGNQDVGLSMMLYDERRCVRRTDGALLLPDDVAGSLIETEHITRTLVMIPREQH